MQAKREQWSGFAKTTQASRLVFLDESGVNINMARRYGRGKGGRRVVDHAPLNTPKSTTILSSIRRMEQWRLRLFRVEQQRTNS